MRACTWAQYADGVTPSYLSTTPPAPLAVRVGRWAGSAMLGLLAGITGSVLQASWWSLLPWGVVLSLVLTAAVLLTAGWWSAGRGGAVAAATGWLLATMAAGWRRPEGDWILVEEWTAYVWQVGGATLILLLLAVPYGRWPREVVFGPRVSPAPGARPPTSGSLPGEPGPPS